MSIAWHTLATAALFSLPLMAQAAPDGTFTASAEASISDLRYSLVDLAPDDGQAPGLTVQIRRPLTLGSSVGAGSAFQSTPIDPLPVNHVNAQGGPGTYAEAGPTLLLARLLADASPARLPEGAVLNANSLILDNRGSGLSAWDSPDQDPPEPQGLVLAPRTALVFDGHAVISSQADAGSVLDHAGQIVQAPYLHVVNSEAVISLKFTNVPVGSSLAEWTQESRSEDRFYGNTAGAADTFSSDRRELPFRLTLTNDSDQPLQAYFDWSIYTRSTSWVTAVPEPSAWVLLAAGLLVIPAVRRA